MQIAFLGAAGTVTGSCYHVRVGKRSLLLDCGLFQGSRREEEQNQAKLPVQEVDAVVLSHAHIDHSGRLPLLVRQGYKGPIYTHEASRDLCRIMLRDAAYLNEKDAEWENKRRRRKGLKPIEPLYTRDDAERAMRHFVGMPFGERREILPGVTIRLRGAGHILGAAIVELWVQENGRTLKLVFSGDLGYSSAALMPPATPIEEADVVLMESTYGDRNHRDFPATLEELETIFRTAAAGGGNILIPAFAVGRTQDLLYLLAKHHDAWRIGEWQVYLDSPMAIEATELYWRYRELLSNPLFREGTKPALAGVQASETSADSQRINLIKSGALVIAGSGMCTGGRILHHLKHNLWRPECHVVIIGYQAIGTLGRRLVDGASYVRLFGETIKVEAKIHTVGGLSAHADQRDLLAWYGAFTSRPPVYLVHGEEQPQAALADALRSRYGATVHRPAFGQTVSL
jgi:metallo-beta-lactamase family protein